MIVGSGDIASVLPDRNDLLFFASGVSNSACTDEDEYQREIDLLLEQPRAAHLVYFSSLGVLDRTERYFRHKRDMEVMVKINFPKNTIVRIGNLDFGDNPHTLINFLRTHPKAEIRDEYRHIISEDELLYWVNKIPSWPCEMNCPGRWLKVNQIVKEYVHDRTN